MKTIFEAETEVIRDAVREVYKKMGCNCLKDAYQECLENALNQRSVFFVAKRELCMGHRGHFLQQVYNPDLLCYGEILLELTAVKNIVSDHKTQLINYLKETRLELGLLINFGSHPEVQIERLTL